MLENCVIIEGKGYISKEVRLGLFEYARIDLVVPCRSNQKDYKPQKSAEKNAGLIGWHYCGLILEAPK